MKTLFHRRLAGPVRRCNSPQLAMLVAVMVSVFGAFGQSDDFNRGNDSGWLHYDLGAIGAGASYEFPSDATNGHAYRVVVPPTGSPANQAPGPGRALTYRTDVTYTGRFSLGVDVVGWNNSIDQAFGPFWCAQYIGLGTSSGYAMTYEPVGHNLRISATIYEYPVYAGLVSGVVLDPSASYRFVASSHDGTTLLAQIFKSNDLQNPLAGNVATDTTFNSGYCGLLMYDATDPSVTGADATFDNYLATTPADALPATVLELVPRPSEGATAFYPIVRASILDRDTTVDSSSLLLWLDGQLLPAGEVVIENYVSQPENPGPQTFPGCTASYPITTLLPAGSVHTNRVAFKDSANVWQTNTWSWTTAYPFLSAGNSLPLGSFPLRGWDNRMVQTNGPALGNSLARAEQQLAVPPLIPFQVTTQTVLQTLNFNDAGDGTTANDFGYFASASPVPGLPPNGTHDNIACEMFAYLELTAGVHRFGAVSDDGFQLRSGAGLRDPNGPVLGVRDGGTFNGTFDFVVEATGLYPVRCVWYENGGAADFQLFSVDLNDPNARILINDPADPAGSVKAFLPLRVVSSPTIDGAFATPPGATIDPVSKTVTVPKSGSSQFYRIQSLNPVTIKSIRIVDANVVLTYE